MTSVRSSTSSDMRPIDTISLLDLVLRKTGSGYLLQTATLETLLSGNLPPALDRLTLNDGDRIVFGGEADALVALKRHVLTSGETASTEIDFPSLSVCMMV